MNEIDQLAKEADLEMSRLVSEAIDYLSDWTTELLDTAVRHKSLKAHVIANKLDGLFWNERLSEIQTRLKELLDEA